MALKLSLQIGIISQQLIHNNISIFKEKQLMKRRDFLKSSATIGGAVVLGVSPNSDAAFEKATIQKYKELGKTGLKMSDISFGCGKLSSASLIARAINRGVNYFDTSPDYGPSESILGIAVKKFKIRDRMIIASKFCNPIPYPGHLHLGSRKRDYIEAVEGSLSRLNTDYLDVCFVHAIGEEESKKSAGQRLLDENMLSAVETLKRDGKIRFLAISSHGPHNLEPLLLSAVKSGHYDIIMAAFNFMKFPQIPEVIQEAKKRKVGVIAMKTLAGAKDMKLNTRGESFPHAAFKWALKHPEVDGLIVTITTIDQLEHYVQASGKKFTALSRDVLNRYAKLYSGEYCRTGCGDCLESCSSKVNIATILRYQMYFQDYGMEKRAMASYSLLEQKADTCSTCSYASCEKACPYGLPVALMLQKAHAQLSLSGQL